ncbi:MAG: ATP-binding protein [Pseudomonadaceae bacterium]|nr:ATP-binding protein [Pseudomonadaceae bacterium]
MLNTLSHAWAADAPNQSPGLFDDPHTQLYQLARYLEVTTTSDGAKPGASATWRNIDGDSFSAGFGRQHHWLRLQFEVAETPQHPRWFYLLNAGNIDTAEFWHHIDGELVSHDIGGTGHRFATRPVAYRQLMFPINLPPGKHELLLRLSSAANFAINPQLATPPAWFEAESVNQTFIAALIGVLLMLAIYNGVVFAMSREAVFLIFSLTLTAGILWRLAITGYASQYLYPDAPLLHDNTLRLAAGGFLTGLILLTRELLQVTRWSARLNRGLKVAALLMAVTIALPVFAYAPLFGLAVIVLSMLLIVLVAIVATWKRVPSAAAYLGALAFAFSGLTFTLLKTYGFLPVDFLSFYTGELTVVALGIMTSVALANRLGEEKAARRVAQNDSAAKSRFLANMSHEIRTPLNAIVGFAELLAADAELPGEVQKKAQRIHRASGKLLGVLNDVLDFSKIDAGKVTLDIQPFQLDGLFEDLAGLFAQPASAAALTLRYTVADDITGWHAGDSQRLHQILANLVSNAIKFTPQGSVLLTARRVGTSQAPSAIEFRVTDTGIGMLPEQVSRLFQPFEQADASTTRRFGGTGLGLAISHRLVAQMGGELKVVSEPEKGSCFWFQIELPATESPDAVASATSHQKSSLAADTRVLIVEDNHTNQILAKAMLKKLGSTCTVAENGAEALKVLAESRDNPFDLVLMDCQMPVMDGYEATRALRKQTFGQTLPIVAMTANALEGDRERCLEAGMSDYITKPISLESLRGVVQRWHATDHQAQPPAQPGTHSQH